MKIIASMPSSDTPDPTSAQAHPANPSPPQDRPANDRPANDRPANDRRRDRRHKILTPAYADRTGSSQGTVLELSEILNLSESGMCMQAPAQLKVNRLLPLGIDLAGLGEHIRTVGYVAWSEPSGKTGIRFPEMAEALRLHLRHWLVSHSAEVTASSAAADAKSSSTLASESNPGAREPESIAARADARGAPGNDVLLFPASGAVAQVSPVTAPATAADHAPTTAPATAPASLRRTILLLLTALLFVGGAIWLGARWLHGVRLSPPPSTLAPPSRSEAPLRQTYIGSDLKDLQTHADAGDDAAEYQLGIRYATGEDVKQDYREAMRWFLRAADHGNVRAQATAATWLWAGRGAPQDYSQAYYWALLAQAGGDESGSAIVVNSAPYLSPAQTAAAQKQAETWLHTHHIGRASPDSAP